MHARLRADAPPEQSKSPSNESGRDQRQRRTQARKHGLTVVEKSMLPLSKYGMARFCELVLLLLGAVRAQPVLVNLDPNVTFGSWEGWGVSLSWWANVLGTTPSASTLADVAFSLDNVRLPWVTNLNEGIVVPGLGFNIARYNAGASSNISFSGQSIVLSPNIPWWKQIQAFWLDWASNDPSSHSWDWFRDAAQVAILQLAAARCRIRGDCRFELFSNSPVWWMLLNHNPSGSASGDSDNLQPWNIANHSWYMAAVAAHARDAWGVAFSSIELFNEPVADWWRSDGTQEGCHFEPDTQAAALATLPAALRHFGLNGSSLRMAASDESYVDMALATWQALGPEAQSLLDQVNVHGYEQGGDRAGLYDAVVVQGRKVLRDSEYGDGDGSGATLAASLLADWSALHPVGWCYWQLLDVSPGWGLLQMDADAGTPGVVNTKYYVVAQFSRHIRPGSVVLGTAGDPRSSSAAAWDPARKVLILVTCNLEHSAMNVTFDLSSFGSVPPGPVAGQWVTNVTSDVPWPSAAYTQVSGAVVTAEAQLVLLLPAMFIATVEVAGVSR